MRARIYIADLVYSLLTLDCESQDDLQKVAELLGFDLVVKESEQMPPPDSKSPDPLDAEAPKPERATKSRPKEGRVSPEAAGEEPAAEAAEAVAPQIPEDETWEVEIEPLEVDPAPPGWFARELESDSVTDVREKTEAPPALPWFDQASGSDEVESEEVEVSTEEVPPLFHPLKERGILLEMVAMPRIGAIDLRLAVRTLAQAKPLTVIPRELHRSVGRGCDILLDMGPGLEPFARDRRGIVPKIENLLGPGHVRCWYFVNCPENGVRLRLWETPVRYPLPERVRPVIIITDLNISQHPLSSSRDFEDEWRAFIRRLGEVGCPVIGLVPFPPQRWPRYSWGPITFIPWDRTTSESTIRQLRV